jgi:hypothetical protein
MPGLFETPDVPQVAQAGDVAKNAYEYNLKTGTANQGLNQIDQYNQFGSLTYKQVGTNPDGTPKYAATQSYTPQQQALLDQLQGTQKTAGTAANKLLGNSADMYSGPTDFANMSSGLTKDLMDKQIAYLTPYYNQQTDQLDTKLRNQGILPGTPAYQQQMAGLKDTQDRSVSGALVQLQPQAFAQTVQNYNMPLETATKLATLGAPNSVKNNLVNTPTTNIAGTDYAGINSNTNAANMSAYNSEMDQYTAMLNGLFGTASSFIKGPGKI